MQSTYLCILSVLAAFPNEPPAATEVAAQAIVGQTEVYRCDFDAAGDKDLDGWPDGWIRRRERGYHEFLKMGILREPAEDSAATSSSLSIELNGGAAQVTSPRISLGPFASYILEGELRVLGLRHDDAQVELKFQDATGKVVASHSTGPVHPASKWQKFRIGPLTPSERGTVAAVVSLLIQPRGVPQDLSGSVALRSVRLYSLPRMTLKTNRDVNLFVERKDVELIAEVAGAQTTSGEMLFELFDLEGNCVLQEVRPLAGIGKEGQEARKSTSAEPVPSATGIARATWKPALTKDGYYRIRASVQGGTGPVLERSTTLAIVPPVVRAPRGEFGWSLPPGEDPLELGLLTDVLSHAGIHWAKYPVSFNEVDSLTADRIAWFAERLSMRGVEMIGVLEKPVRLDNESSPTTGQWQIASVFEDRQIWQPWIDPVMTRLSLKVRWWQLGSDRDVSFVGYPQLADRIREVKEHSERFGQEVHLGIGWRWVNPTPPTAIPLAYLNLQGDPELTAEELGVYLKEKPAAGARRWISLEPLARGEYTPQVRAHDLVTRMIAAKIHAADAAFIPQPFDPQHGLMNPDGTPSELFLPWRTTAAALAGAEYLGAWQLPAGSTNHVFARDGQAVMFAWNDLPVVETSYFGAEIKQTDLWGRQSAPADAKNAEASEQQVLVGPEPTLITGLNEAVARWRLSVKFENSRMESVFGREQTIVLKFRNPFPQGVEGEIHLHAPKSWNHAGEDLRFKLAGGDEARIPIGVTLLADANSGPQNIRLDFVINADETYQFSVPYTLQLGLEDVTIEMATRLRGDGTLIVEQHLTNLTDSAVSFQCVLFPPGRRRETRQVINLGRGRNTLVFLLPKGEELAGQKIILRAEEIGGPRVLNYSITAER